ncbi:MAG: hypothetical protein AB1Z98_15490 [Nannocystaceae bacterium]
MPAASPSDTLHAADLVVAFRCALGLPPLDRPPTDDLPGHLDPGLVVEGVNHRWLIAWAVAGLELFAEGTLPTMASATIAAKRVVSTLAMDAQGGSVTSAARLLGTGTRNLRRTLEEAACYPWRDPMDRHPPTDPVSWCRCADELDFCPGSLASDRDAA